MAERTFASVTETPCCCGFLEQAAHDPDSPVSFDSELCEYHFQYGEAPKRRTLMIYHCFFCGGRAPKSRRDALFARVSEAEEARLVGLFADMRTIEEVIDKFGAPQEDLPRGVGIEHPEEADRPPMKEWFRSLVYTGLSEVAVVRVTDYNKARVHVTIEGKFFGDAG